MRDVEDQGKMIDAIRDEHARVYLQDQALLKSIKESRRHVSGMNQIPVVGNSVDGSNYNFEDGVRSDRNKSKTGLFHSFDKRSVATALEA